MARSGGRWRDLPAERLGPYQTVKRRYYRNKTIYKERNIIERFFAKLKHFRRVATRYDKLLANFLGLVKIAAIALCIKRLNRHYDLEALCDLDGGPRDPPGGKPNRLYSTSRVLVA